MSQYRVYCVGGSFAEASDVYYVYAVSRKEARRKAGFEYEKISCCESSKKQARTHKRKVGSAVHIVNF